MNSEIKDPMTQALPSAQIASLDEFIRASMTSLDILQFIELTVAESTVMELNIIREMHPEWNEKYESIDIETAPSNELMDLLASAPNTFAKGLISGALRVRLSISAITGRTF